MVAAVQAEVLPYDKNYLRHGARLAPALDALDDLWAAARTGLHGAGDDVVRARSAAAMVAHARWMYNAALARTETRGMHKRDDFPDQEPRWHHRLLTGGLDTVWTAPETSAAAAAAS